MYNASTERLIRETPQIGDIDMTRLPQELTRIYARIISIRRDFMENGRRFPKSFEKEITLLRTLAANLETLTVLNRDHEHHRSAAFVAGTAHYLLSMVFQRQSDRQQLDAFTPQSIPPSISAMVLFLIGNSPADAAEVASHAQLSFSSSAPGNVTDAIFKAVSFLATGELEKLGKLEPGDIEFEAGDETEEAVSYLWQLIFNGVKELANILLGNGASSSRDYFREVISLSYFADEQLTPGLQSSFSGPLQLASLLNLLGDELLGRGVIWVPGPSGVDSIRWLDFLKRLARERPYLWENHFKSIETEFLNPGQSAVLTFPTGAGKTTLSELKIASALMNEKSIIYLVPTHALEDQVNKSLSKLFSGAVRDLELEIGGEYTEIADETPVISVMTPERCLTRLSVNPESFAEIGLVVFDEFHLINGKDQRLERRSLDAMFCLLRLFVELPTADFLLISAMVENGAEISEWVQEVTGRPCHNFNSSWKPTRQLHGCVIFQEQEIAKLQEMINAAKNAGKTKHPGAALKKALLASAYQIFSLKNMWDTTDIQDYFISSLLGDQVQLAAGASWNLTSNRNEVAADLAVYFAKLGIKTLVFVDHPGLTISTAKKVLEKVGETVSNRAELIKRNERKLESLEMELGDLKFSHFVGTHTVAVHHGLMLPIERRLNEQFFKDPQGPNVVIATATLAQGINLPAEVVIIAGDDRFDEETDRRETVPPHEILNAAGRAGRAGSAAQGVVLIVPGEVVSFDDETRLGQRWWDLKKQVFSKSDQCLVVRDPLNHLLDTLTEDIDALSADQKNIIFRLNVETGVDHTAATMLNKSLAAFHAKKNDDGTFEEGIKKLIDVKSRLAVDLVYPQWVENVSIKMGVEPQVVDELGDAIDKITCDILFSLDLEDLIAWMFEWLHGNSSRIEGLFASSGAQTELARALDLSKDSFTMEQVATRFNEIMPVLVKYMQGASYKTIEDMIRGRSNDFLLKARHFILKLVPHFSFAFGVLGVCIREKCLEDNVPVEKVSPVILVLATLIREGFDSIGKLKFKIQHPWYLRVQCHERFGQQS